MTQSQTVVDALPPPAPQPHHAQVLVVDDDPVQTKLARLRLESEGFDVRTVPSAEDALEVLKHWKPDVVLSDVMMEALDGFDFCVQVRKIDSLSNVPIVLMSSRDVDAVAQHLATRVGAFILVQRTADFTAEIQAVRASLLEERPSGPPALDESLFGQHLRHINDQAVQLGEQATHAELRYRALFENANDAITIMNPEGVILEANNRWETILGVPAKSLVGRHVRDLAPPGHESKNVDLFNGLVANGADRADAVPMQRADGSTIYMQFSLSVVQIEGKPVVFSIGSDVTERIQSAAKLAAAEEKYRSVVERMPDAIWTADLQGNVTFVTPNIEQITGLTAEEMCAEDLETRIRRVHPDDRAHVTAAFNALATEGTRFDIEYRRQRKDGSWGWVRNRANAAYERDGQHVVEGTASDINERKRFEESLRQAQKMEAIGQLTGGIAHDFNNMLAAILANSHFLLDELPPQDPRRTDAEQIKIAAERAAALTRQLLAFSRNQVLEPTIVEPRTAIVGLESMLRRLIGADIDFSVVADESVGTVRVDVGQLEQVILNLVVNARDAMPRGGKVSIEMSNVDLGEGTHIPLAPGSYVMIAVSDNGSGMSPETMRHMFEPFFTTKEVGKGTGLGLSTCYGIIKQSGGHIWVYSELDKGTVFKIYLPRVYGNASVPIHTAPTQERRGSETVLLIEDDANVRLVVTRMLESRGYRVLIARDGSEARAIAKADASDVRLVLSDVVMPGISGPDIVTELREYWPQTKSLFMSGYTQHSALRDGALEAGVNFIQKPFSPETLATKVREVLDA